MKRTCPECKWSLNSVNVMAGDPRGFESSLPALFWYPACVRLTWLLVEERSLHHSPLPPPDSASSSSRSPTCPSSTTPWPKEFHSDTNYANLAILAERLLTRSPLSAPIRVFDVHQVLAPRATRVIVLNWLSIFCWSHLFNWPHRFLQQMNSKGL